MRITLRAIPISRNFWRHALLALIVAGSFVLMLSMQPFGQNPEYHLFADHRSFFNIPNFFDVISNLPFAVVGATGIRFCFRNHLSDARAAWLTFFAGVTLVSFGSAYYHWHPNNETLVWDRLPMAIGFMGLFVALLSEYVNAKIYKVFLVPAIFLGLSSVLYWYWSGDLRFYAWVQIIPLLTIPFLALLYRGRYSDHLFLLGALVFYVLAKVSAIYDREVLMLTHNLLSGHSLKHLLAALATLAIIWMMRARRLHVRCPIKHRLHNSAMNHYRSL